MTDKTITDRLKYLSQTAGTRSSASFTIHHGEQLPDGQEQFSYSVTIGWDPDEKGMPREAEHANDASPDEAFRKVLAQLTARP